MSVNPGQDCCASILLSLDIPNISNSGVFCDLAGFVIPALFCHSREALVAPLFVILANAGIHVTVHKYWIPVPACAGRGPEKARE